MGYSARCAPISKFARMAPAKKNNNILGAKWSRNVGMMAYSAVCTRGRAGAGRLGAGAFARFSSGVWGRTPNHRMPFLPELRVPATGPLGRWMDPLVGEDNPQRVGGFPFSFFLL